MLSLPGTDPSGNPVLVQPDPKQAAPGRLLLLYGRLIGFLLAGYLLFDKAFAYLHLPGTPLYIGEMVLLVGVLGSLTATGYISVVLREDPMLALLAAFFLWSLIRFLPGLHAYGIDAVRDFALVYYCLFAFFIAAALERSPGILERLIAQLNRFAPWLLLWLPFGVILGRMVTSGPTVPFTTIPVLTHKSGDGAIAALLALGSLWLFPAGRSTRSIGLWSIASLVVIALAATQNRGGLLSAVAAVMVGLAFFRDRLRLIGRAAVVIALIIGIGTLLPLQIPGTTASQGRAFSVSQLYANVASIAGAQETGNQNGTVAGRKMLWSQVLQKQESDSRLVNGYGFGPNLAFLAGGAGASGYSDAPLRSPHNSHLDVMARLGIIGLSLWIALWVGWYWRLVTGCRRLARAALHGRRRVAVLCLMVNTATLVSSFFDPQLEGAQAAVLVWIAFGVGLAVTSFRAWFRDQDLNPDRA
jgi:hypothetical protein